MTTGSARLETPRLVLRPLVPGDLDRLTEIWTDPEVARLLVTQPRDRGEVAEKLAELIEYARGFGMWGAELRPSGELIGRCGFYPFEDKNGAVEPELAYLLARAHWGVGLASEASRAALDALFRARRPARVVAMTRPEHAASRRVLAKLGMRAEGRIVVKGIEVVLHALTRWSPEAGA